MNLIERVLTNISSGCVKIAAPNNLVILTYHRILPEPDPYLADVVDRATFAWQMSVLNKYYQVLPLTEAVDKLYSGNLPSGAIAVTFDDGYADNYHTALPILKQYNIPATIFVATGFLDGGIMWNDQLIESIRNAQQDSLDLSEVGLGRYSLECEADRIQTVHAILENIKYMDFARRSDFAAQIQQQLAANIPTDLMLTSEQVKQLSQQGVEIGGHTDLHPILSNLSDAQAEQEIASGREKLHAITGKAVQVFAYPNGRYRQDFGDRDIDIVRKLGFTSAVSTAWGSATSASNRWKLPRGLSWDKTPLRFWMRMLQCQRYGDPHLAS